MFHKGSILVLAAFLALPAFSEEPPSSPTPAPKAGAKKKRSAKVATTPAPARGSNVIVTRDPETGEVRPATQEEIDRLRGPRAAALPEPVVVTLPDGTKKVSLDGRNAHHAVVTKGAEGSVSQSCVPADQAAPSATPTPSK